VPLSIDCLSVCLSHLATRIAAAGLLLWVKWAGNIDRLLQHWRENAGSVALSAHVDN